MRPLSLALLGGAALVAASYANARAADAIATADDGDGTTALDNFNAWGLIERQYNSHQTGNDMSSQNLRAFLAMIRAAEGTDRAADPYRVCYAYRYTIKNFQEHPAVSGEWKGEPLPSNESLWLQGRLCTSQC